VSILQHAQTNTANLDSEIAALGANLAALQDMARSFPVGVTIPLDKRAAFDEMSTYVEAQIARISCTMATLEWDALHR